MEHEKKVQFDTSLSGISFLARQTRKGYSYFYPEQIELELIDRIGIDFSLLSISGCSPSYEQTLYVLCDCIAYIIKAISVSRHCVVSYHGDLYYYGIAKHYPSLHCKNTIFYTPCVYSESDSASMLETWHHSEFHKDILSSVIREPTDIDICGFILDNKLCNLFETYYSVPWNKSNFLALLTQAEAFFELNRDHDNLHLITTDSFDNVCRDIEKGISDWENCAVLDATQLGITI